MIAPAQPQQGGPSRENDPPPAEPSTQTKKAEKGKKPKKPALPVFHKLEAGFQWWVEDGESVSSRNARIKNQVAIGPGKVLLPAERVALGLNELCCERGLGKVYVFLPYAGYVLYSRLASTHAFAAIPELLYIPEDWDDEDRRRWKDLKPERQLSLIHSRNGMIPHDMAVVPFAVNLWESKGLSYPLFETHALTQAPVLVCIGQRPERMYVGRRDQMQYGVTKSVKKVTMRRRAEYWGSTPAKIVYQAMARDRGHFQVHGGRGILGALDELYEWRHRSQGTSDGDVVMRYGALREMLIEAGRQAAEVGQPYGTTGDISWVIRSAA
ncbi:hypothetical protein ABEF91_006809 [Exophiala dermatitidis]